MNSSIWRHLDTLAKAPVRHLLGLMSGTSLDGVDIAWITLQGFGTDLAVQLQAFQTVSYPPALQKKLCQQTNPKQATLPELATLHIDLGYYFAECILEQLAVWQLTPHDIDLIGSHGQTIIHHPKTLRWDESELHATLQIGDADQIAFQTGIPTVSDFRLKEIAAGGTGAPLLPYLDFLIFEQLETPRVLHNLGGISNLTWLPGSGLATEVIAFDTGPGNLLIDLAMQSLQSNIRWDQDGSFAAKGQIQFSLLNRWLNYSFFQELPPKSTDRAELDFFFHQQILADWQQTNFSSADILATITALTAYSIEKAYHNLLPALPQEAYFSGGGVHNVTLMQQLQTVLPEVHILDFVELGWTADSREAVAFAILADLFLREEKITFSGITGAVAPVLLGKLSLP